MRLYILDDNGRVIFDSEDDPEIWPDHYTKEDRVKVLQVVNLVLRFLLNLKNP